MEGVLFLESRGRQVQLKKQRQVQWRLEIGIDIVWDVFEDFGIRYGNIQNEKEEKVMECDVLFG